MEHMASNILKWKKERGSKIQKRNVTVFFFFFFFCLKSIIEYNYTINSAITWSNLEIIIFFEFNILKEKLITGCWLFKLNACNHNMQVTIEENLIRQKNDLWKEEVKKEEEWLEKYFTRKMEDKNSTQTNWSTNYETNSHC